MISNKEITEFITSKIVESNEINDYCVNTFGKQLKIFIGVDVNKPPQEEEMPCLIIEPTMKNVGTNDSYFSHEIIMSLAIVGKENPTVIGNVMTYDGIYEIEELGNMITKLIKDKFSSNSNMDTYDVSFYHDIIDAFPIYSGNIVASISVDNVIGADKIEFF